MTKDRKQRTPTSRRWECVFPHPASELVDERVDKRWKSTFGGRTPFGDLRNQFRRKHCRTLNPYGSETCPYSRDVCALAFEDAVRVTCDARPGVPMGYFMKVAKTLGAIRADAKPLARDRMNVLVESAPPNFSENHADPAARPPDGLETGPREVPGTPAGPVSIGDLFGSLGIQPRQGSEPADAGKKGTE